MPKCFLSYSSSYDHLKEPFRQLLEALGFEVEIFDGPDQNSIPEAVISKIDKSDAMVALYGPGYKPIKKQKCFEGAKWPHDEVVLARGMSKPIVIILHSHTCLPSALEGYSTPARFDFWNPQSFMENVHHVVKSLSDFKRTLEYLRGEQPFLDKKVVCRFRILSYELMTIEIYNEVVARKKWSVFHHAIDYSYDDNVILPSLPELKYKLEKRVGPESINATIKFGDCTTNQIEYFVILDPELEAGQSFGYWRSFQIPNTLPLTRSQIAIRSKNTDIPKKLGDYSYGDCWLVTTELDSFTLAFHFPRNISIKKYGACVWHNDTKQENVDETERCKALVEFQNSPDMSEQILELTVQKPLVNHAYFLLYEPAL
jgi:hypothetical protein